MKIIIHALTVMLFFLAPGLLTADTIKSVASNFLPLDSFREMDGIGYGIYGDIARAIIAESGHKADFTYLPLPKMLKSFASRETPFVQSSSRSIQLAQIKLDQLDIIHLGFFSQHFFYFKSDFPEEITYAKYEDLAPYKVCAIQGSFIVPVLEKAGVTVDQSITNESCVKKLALKRNDIWGSTDLSAHYYTSKLYPDRLADLAHTASGAASQDEIIMASFKSDAASHQLYLELSAAFERLKKDGTIIKIMQKYWGTDVPVNVLPLDMR